MFVDEYYVLKLVNNNNVDEYCLLVCGYGYKVSGELWLLLLYY